MKIILTKKIVSPKLPEYKYLKQLYRKAFPKDERLPWFFLMKRTQKQFIEFIAFYDDENFVGFAYNITRNDLTYIFYLAVDAKYRGQGFGSEILQELRQMYSHHRLSLSAEAPDPQAENAKERDNRIRFYQRNGFTLSGKLAVESGVTYTMLQHGGDFSEAEYIALMKNFAGIFSPLLKINFQRQ